MTARRSWIGRSIVSIECNRLEHGLQHRGAELYGLLRGAKVIPAPTCFQDEFLTDATGTR